MLTSSTATALKHCGVVPSERAQHNLLNLLILFSYCHFLASAVAFSSADFFADKAAFSAAIFASSTISSTFA